MIGKEYAVKIDFGDGTHLYQCDLLTNDIQIFKTKKDAELSAQTWKTAKAVEYNRLQQSKNISNNN